MGVSIQIFNQLHFFVFGSGFLVLVAGVYLLTRGVPDRQRKNVKQENS